MPGREPDHSVDLFLLHDEPDSSFLTRESVPIIRRATKRYVMIGGILVVGMLVLTGVGLGLWGRSQSQSFDDDATSVTPTPQPALQAPAEPQPALPAPVELQPAQPALVKPRPAPAAPSEPTTPSQPDVTGPGSTGKLFTITRPIGAQVFLDDKLVGTTPLFLSGLTLGAHQVRLELQGFKTYSSRVRIEPTERFHLAVQLEQ